MSSYSYYLAESFNEDPALLDEYGEFLDDYDLDNLGGLPQISEIKQAQEQGFVAKNVGATVSGAATTPADVVRKGQEVVNTINMFESDARKQQTALLEQAENTTARANELFANLSTSLEELSTRLQNQFEEQSANAKRETEASQNALEELNAARRRALTGEGMIKQAAPDRAVGIGELMTRGRASRGGSQRAATSEFLRNPPMIGEYDG